MAFHTTGHHVIMMSEAQYSVELPTFEGPLDLLLYLVRKHELSILDIPVAFVTEKYLEHLSFMRQLNLDVAAEYLLMAATLTYLKSRELLPVTEAPLDDEAVEEVDSRALLIRRLLEYQRFKDAAEHLDQRLQMGRDVFVRRLPEENEEADAPLCDVNIFQLVEAFGDILRRTQVPLASPIVVDRISVVERIQQLVEKLECESFFTLESCLDLELGLSDLRHQIVVTFLALLEMAKLRLIQLTQSSHKGALYVVRTDSGIPIGQNGVEHV